LSLP